MGYSPWGCKESDMTEQLSVPAGIQKLFTQVLSQLAHPGGGGGKRRAIKDELVSVFEGPSGIWFVLNIRIGRKN